MSHKRIGFLGGLALAAALTSALSAGGLQASAASDPAIDARATALLQRLRGEPDDAKLWVALAKDRIEQRDLRSAVELLEEADRRGSREPRLGYHIARLWLALRQKNRAVEALDRYLRQTSGDTAAQDLLEKLTGPGCSSVPVTDPLTFARIAEQERCFEVQQNLQAACLRYTLRRRRAVRLMRENGPQLLAELLRLGDLDAPVIEPAGNGYFETDAVGTMRCSVHGPVVEPCAEGSRLPRLSRVHASVELLETAARSGNGPSRIAVARLAAMRRLAGAGHLFALCLEGERDSIALEIVLRVAVRASRASDGPELARVAEPLLRHGARPVRLRAANVLFKVGRTPELSLDDAFAVMSDESHGRADKPFMLAVFDRIGAKAIPRLCETLHEESGWLTAPVLQVMSRHKDRRVAEALVRALESPAKKWKLHARAVLYTLATFAGKDLGDSPAVWRAWMKTEFGK